ncbi:glutathione S-transferase T3-like [Raphanus sativus]|nr:glutathione S-transferase T3-like [Raphanus sativus]XP_056853300.1 glutathione S-transferase T3-like [Raphanus sativus]
MDFNPFHDSANFVELLNSQQNVVFGSQSEGSVSLSASQAPLVASQEAPAERKGRRTWTTTDDIVLISSWLNTSKDPLVGNEQKCTAFWQRIADYFSASPKVAGGKKITKTQCKQRWHKMNDKVNKFCGAYEAATRNRTSGMNEDDVLKMAHDIFLNNHQKKFTFEHAWKELRDDQKWCLLSVNGSSSKRRKFDNGSHSESSHAATNETNASVDAEGTPRPPGVKAAKAQKWKKVGEEKEVAGFNNMWSIKKEDLAMKTEITKMRLLESLVNKQVPLDEYEEVLKKKLIKELM